MYELTTGDERYVQESMYVRNGYLHPILNEMESVPAEVRERIDGLSEAYVNEFHEYYINAKTENEKLHAGEIHNGFDEKWNAAHPDFYNVDALLEGCSEEDIKKADALIKMAKEAFGA